jgi:hypothetical protein
MKKQFLLLIIAMIPLLVISQNTNICLPKSTMIEAVKGLKQGNLLKTAFLKSKINENKLQKSVKEGKEIENDLNLEVNYLKEALAQKDSVWQDIEKAYLSELQQNQKDIDRLVKQRDKHIIIGPYIGYGISPSNFLQPQIQIGIGINYRLIRL